MRSFVTAPKSLGVAEFCGPILRAVAAASNNMTTTDTVEESFRRRDQGPRRSAQPMRAAPAVDNLCAPHIYIGCDADSCEKGYFSNLGFLATVVGNLSAREVRVCSFVATSSASCQLYDAPVLTSERER